MASGLKINISKSGLESISMNHWSLSGFIDSSKNVYLGIPGGNLRSIAFWDPLAEWISKHLDGCKGGLFCSCRLYHCYKGFFIKYPPLLFILIKDISGGC